MTGFVDDVVHASLVLKLDPTQDDADDHRAPLVLAPD
jgi:hypothetical protein